MHSRRFSRYVLRTTNVPAAEAFYASVLGHHGDQIFPLHEQALARGARPHWLGHIDVSDPAAAAAPLLAAGGQQLGERADGIVVLRDPGGAIVALGGASAGSRAGVLWHVLRARNIDSLAALYAETFGWAFGEYIALGNGERYRALAFSGGERNAGVVGELSEGVHPHWLFFFGVDSLKDAVARVRAHGGLVMEPSALPDGTEFAVCDDPQGAAFGLMKR
jgi:predicted enzyme related to lactoylglutathione lyase